ncbi:eukaryotic translation initiation factor [Tubulinosema ratisbonensis]|uniref:Eukaryotic translation initiation factor n=1 Tax=Tubulinosema ratisbonensis TaxID=291195 RepID=A0A437AIJ4_9MICR|nr:eukaryotic translation initiation factor [Tubulinosema ratisbonensis]
MADDEFVPVGFDINEFESRSDSESYDDQLTNLDERGFPKQLQYKYLLDKAMKELDKLRGPTNQQSKIPLDVRREGGKITFNLKEVSAHLNREEDHLKMFILSELNTSGNVNSEGRLSIKGRFTKKQLQDTIRDYIDQFVVCKSCFKTDDTIIYKENRMYFLKCNLCNAIRHVGSISEGIYKR